MRGYSIRTEKTYLYWIKAFINFHDKRHPETMETKGGEQFLTFLANRRNVAINTQKIALNALAYLYQKHLHHELGDLCFCYATKQRHLPAVLSPLPISPYSDARQTLFVRPKSAQKCLLVSVDVVRVGCRRFRRRQPENSS